MATDALQPIPLSTDAEQVLIALEEARAGTLALVAQLDDEHLERVHSPIMSPLVWDLGHIAAYEDLWLAHRHGGMPLLRPELADSTTRSRPRARCAARSRRSGRETRAPTWRRCARAPPRRSPRAGVGDGVVCEMVLRHELQHSETMRQTLAIAGLLPRPGERERQIDAPLDRPPARPRTGVGGDPRRAVRDGRRAGGLRLRQRAPAPHASRRAAFRIARRPVSNASWMRFARAAAMSGASGGRTRAGRGGRSTTAPTIPPWQPATREAPACHVCWFEADAFARAHGARLPTEAEWEKAATWSRSQPTPSGSTRSARCGSGRERFRGYPGFVAYPYREYSEVFFGDAYRVLRGGSWATEPARRERDFRNWDLPQRRQIFAGVRLARDARDGRSESRRCVPSRTPRDETPASRRGCLRWTPSRSPSRRGGDPHRLASGRRPRTLARRGRARRPHAPVQGAAAEALLRRARRRAVRPDLRAARVLPHARRARDPRGGRGRARRADGRRRAGRARLGHGGQDARAARRAARRRHAAALRPGGRHREHGARLRRGADRASTRACRCTA